MPTIIVVEAPSWAKVLVPAGLEVLFLVLAALIGAKLGARWTRKQALQLHRTQREQDALLGFLDLLSMVDLAMRRSLPSPPQEAIWVEAVPGLGAKYIREHPGVTWDRSDHPDQELFQWGNVVGALLDAEEQWRGHIMARVNRPGIVASWWKILDTGARMGMKGSSASGPHLERLHADVVRLMDEIRALA